MRSEAKKFRTVASLIVMALSGVAGFFIGAALGNAWGGAICSIIPWAL